MKDQISVSSRTTRISPRSSEAEVFQSIPVTDAVLVPICGLVARVPGYRPRDTGFDSRCYQILYEFVGMERRPLVRINEELLE
jgi:hypothetical protein